MLQTRIIPALLLREDSLVKTVKFDKPTYVGDPANTVRIFNELEVDELIFLDIRATVERRGPKVEELHVIANECFMPLGYGGGIRSLAQAKSVFDIGFEKIVVNSHCAERPEFLTELAAHYGSQAVIASIDVKTGLFGRRQVRTRSGTHGTGLDPVAWAQEVERRGAGEILLTSIDREGTWSGFDVNLVREVSQAVDIPVIAHGGGGTIAHIAQVVREGLASAVALGSMVVFQKKGMGVLINVPDALQLSRALAE